MATPSPVPADNPETVQRILQAAERLFAQRGFDGASISAIAAEAGVSKANVFHHFASKDALYLAVLGAACRASSHLLDELAEQPGPLGERLGRFAQKHLAHLHAQARTTRLVLREVLENRPGRGRELAEQVVNENFGRLVGMLREAQRQGELRAELDPALVATVLVGANVFFFQAQAVLQHLPDIAFAGDPACFSRMLTELLLHGVRPAGQS